MAEHNEAQVWSVIRGENHPSLTGDERTIAGYMPLVEELFPGINYFSIILWFYTRKPLFYTLPPILAVPSLTTVQVA